MRVRCERLDDFGRGICFYNGKIVFVSGVLPFEECEIDIVMDKKKYMVGKLIKIYNVSDRRICPKCVYKDCGCHIIHMDYLDTLNFKKEKVKNVLKKYSGIDMDLKIVASDKVYGYRNKVTLKVKNGVLGFYKNGTHDIIKIDRCLIASNRINSIISLLGKEDLSKVCEITIKDMDDVMVVIKGYMNIENLKKSVSSIYMNNKLVYGNSMITNRIGEYEFYVSKNSFFQINNDVTLKLYNKILDYIGTGDRCMDLFCGCGTISMFLSKKFKEVIGIEINEEAVNCAVDNLKLNNTENVSFRCADANDIIGGRFDALVVDPARAGLGNNGVKNILKSGVRRIVYVSCNPSTLARDIKLLDKYVVKDITLFDMFPWTYHVECVCLLERVLDYTK